MVIDYYQYIKSEQWYKRTESIRKRNKGICECCNMRYGDSIHHRTYKRLGNELDEDLIHLCDQCHKMVHRLGIFFIWPSRVEFLNQLRKEIKDEIRNIN